MEALPPEIHDVLMAFITVQDLQSLACVSSDWMYTCSTHPDYSWWMDLLHHDPGYSSEEAGCSCGCGASCDMFCYIETYRWELRGT